MSKIAVVGQNPTAYFAAVLLEKAGHDVTILDSGAGQFSHLRTSPFEISSVPSDPAAFEALAQVEAALEMSLVGGEKEASPIYFEGGEPKPFLGFGDSKFDSITPLSSFNFSNTLHLTQDLAVAAQRARGLFTGKVMTYTEVLKVEMGDDRIEHLVLSSGENFTADFFVFCDSPRHYLNLIPADMINARLRGRMLKTPIWSRVKIHFNHVQNVCAPELLDRTIFLIPGGTTQEPFVGQIFSTAEGQRSVWQAYLNDETSEEPEVVSSTIKHMRRMLQKSFAADEFRKEHVLMAEPEAFADFAWTREGVHVEDDIENVVLGSPLLSHFNGLMACVEQARRIYLSVTTPRQKRSKEPTILAHNSASC